ncbi:MAG: hypothetical protein ABIU09_01640 [Pyrinomonadaceae bacterium]
MDTTTSTRKNKHLILNQDRLERAKQILGVTTETETVEIALERVITESETNKRIWAAHNGFVTSMTAAGLEIEDVFGNLEEK